MSTPSALTIKAARTWVGLAALVYAYDILRSTGTSLTDPTGRPIGDDFVNYWAGAFLAWHGRVADVYNWPVYHAFQQSIVGELNPYLYGYSPVLLILTAPLAMLPYLPGLGVWLVSSWFAFYRALKLALPEKGALLLSLATPALFVNAYGGQNGAWTAALFGGGLCLIDRRPLLAGMMFGAMTYKPHLGLLIPIALLAGRRWTAIAGACISAGVLILASLLLYGVDAWRGHSVIVNAMRITMLEDGTLSLNRMVSVFAFARRLGSGLQFAYAAQVVAALLAAAVVALAWLRDVPQPIRNAALVVGTLFSTPYLQDYDTVVCAFVAVWLMGSESLARVPERQATIAAGLLLILPLLNASISHLADVAIGPLAIAPAFVLIAKIVLGEQAAVAPAVR